MRDNFFIKDPIHKEITIIDNNKKNIISELINTKEFQRLKYIYQLGLAYKWFPSATHSRFSHCIGTYEVVCKFTEVLKVNSNDAKLVQIAGLLHDIGHGPLSHVFEKIAPKINNREISHEEWTVKIINDPNTEINKVLRKYKIDIKQVIAILDGTHKNKWMTQLISSDLDCDRIDYLLRDSYFVGTHYGTIDLNVLLKRVKIINNQLCFSEASSNLIKSFWYARVHMNSDIYENKNLRVFEWILESIFNRLREVKNIINQNKDKIYYFDRYSWIIFNQKISIKEYILMDDPSLFSFLESIKNLNLDKILNDLFDGFQNGNKFTYATEDNFKKYKLEKYKDNIYAFKEETLKSKKVYSDNEKYNVILYNEQHDKLTNKVSLNIIKFKDSELKKTMNNKAIEYKIFFINENIVK